MWLYPAGSLVNEAVGASHLLCPVRLTCFITLLLTIAVCDYPSEVR